MNKTGAQIYRPYSENKPKTLVHNECFGLLIAVGSINSARVSAENYHDKGQKCGKLHKYAAARVLLNVCVLLILGGRNI
jgi:hypothetical protein